MKKISFTLAILLFSLNIYAKPATTTQDSALTSDEHIGHRADHSQTPGQVSRNQQAQDRMINSIRNNACAGGCTVVIGVISGSAGATGPVMGGVIAGASFACERACP